MANVVRQLERIENAIYGEEVRSSIHDAIDEINKQAIESYETAVDSQESCLNSKNIVLEARDEVAANAAQVSTDTQTTVEAKNRVVQAQEVCEEARDIAVESKDIAVEAKEAAVNANNSIQIAKADAIAAKNRSEECRDDILGIYGSIGNGFTIKGPATLPTLPENPLPGWMYIITEPFTTDSSFMEGEGIEKPAGTPVYYTDSNKWALSYGDNIFAIVDNLYSTLAVNGFTEVLKTSEGEPLSTSDNRYVLSLKALSPEFRHYLIGSYITLSLLLGNSIETIYYALIEMEEV